MRKVGVCEFKDRATALLASGETLVIERHGAPVGSSSRSAPRTAPVAERRSTVSVRQYPTCSIGLVSPKKSWSRRSLGRCGVRPDASGRRCLRAGVRTAARAGSRTDLLGWLFPGTSSTSATSAHREAMSLAGQCAAYRIGWRFSSTKKSQIEASSAFDSGHKWMILIATLPRSTRPMNVRCKPDASASCSWVNPRAVRSVLIRSPNALQWLRSAGPVRPSSS